MKREVIVWLDNVRSAHNVGSIFRTADGAGVNKIYLGGYTPTPIDRFGRQQSEIEKTSLGATKTVSWEQVSEAESVSLFQQLKEQGTLVVAVEQAPQSVPIYEFNLPEKVCYIFGNEIEGVQKKFLDIADTVVEIPMVGQKESLNVSVSAGIVLFYR